MMPTERGNRICAMMDEVCRGKRYEAADAHRQAGEDMERLFDIPHKPDPWHDFLAGWDEAMALRDSELAAENQYLHSVIFDLVTRLMIERCPDCKGDAVLHNCDPCPNPKCQQGWVDKPTPNPESPCVP